MHNHALLNFSVMPEEAHSLVAHPSFFIWMGLESDLLAMSL